MLNEKESRLLFNAIRAGELNIIEPLIQKSGTECKNAYGWTPIMMASFWGQFKLVQYFIDCHASLTQTSKMGLTAIMLAAVQEHQDIVRLLYQTTTLANPG